MSTLRRLHPRIPLGWVRHMTRPAGAAGTLLAYLDRYTIFRQKDSGANPWRVYLHHFLAPDAEGAHNHPSRYSLSVNISALWGASYTEEILELDHKCTWHERNPKLLEGYPDYDFCMGGSCRDWVIRSRKVRLFNWIPATKYHRITEIHPGLFGWGCWTVFVCSGLTGRGWGWWEPGRGHVDHTERTHTKVTTQ